MLKLMHAVMKLQRGLHIMSSVCLVYFCMLPVSLMLLDKAVNLFAVLCSVIFARKIIFTALHGMQSRYSDGISFCLSVCPSVRLSVRQTRALWQNGRKLCLDCYIIWKNIYPSFLRRRMVGGGRPLIPEILGQPARVGAKSPISNR